MRQKKTETLLVTELILDDMLFEAFGSGLPHESYAKWIKYRDYLLGTEKCFRDRQSKAGKAPKSPIKPLVAELVRAFPDHSPRELWPNLFALLEKGEHNPEETGKKTDPKTWKIEYCTDSNDSRLLKFITFKNIVSQVKKRSHDNRD